MINALNVKHKEYSNAQIFVMVPLQMVFPQGADEPDDHAICRLASDLELLWKGAHLSWDDIFNVSAYVAEEIKIADEQYYNHLVKSMADRIVAVDVYDFAREILDEDKVYSDELWNELYNKKKKNWHEG